MIKSIKYLLKPPKKSGFFMKAFLLENLPKMV